MDKSRKDYEDKLKGLDLGKACEGQKIIIQKRSFGTR